MADNKQKYYKVGADGKAPKGLKSGDQVVTGGGTWRIDAVRPDGSYASTLVDKNLTTGNFRGEYAVPGQKENPADGMKDMLSAWSEAAAAQKQNRIDRQTAEQIASLTQSMEETDAQYRAQREQNEIDTARALDNAALYAEARGDRGGIGKGQYNAVQAAGLRNAQTIRAAQTKLASDTARQVAALRAQGEFQKAYALLDVAQSHLSQLLNLEKWGADWEDSQERLQRNLEQWERSHALSVANLTGKMPDGSATRAAKSEQRSQMAAAGEALLKVGVMPGAEQLAAMGMSAAQAQAYINSLIRQGKVY